MLRLQQDMNLYGETVSPTRLIFLYIKSLSKRDKLKAFIAPNIKYIIKFLNNNGKSDIYTGGNIHGIFCYREKIVAPSTLTTSCCYYKHVGPSSCINNNIATFQPIIDDICIQQKTIFECSGIIGLKDDACSIRGPKLISSSLRINMNQFKSLQGDEPNETPRE